MKNIDDTLLDDAFKDYTSKRKEHLDNWIIKYRKMPKGRQMGNILSEVRVDHRNRYFLAQEYLLNCQLTNKILDLGCGTGYGSFMLSEYVKHIDCVDLSSQAKKGF